jgi:hypothetical protein
MSFYADFSKNDKKNKKKKKNFYIKKNHNIFALKFCVPSKETVLFS